MWTLLPKRGSESRQRRAWIRTRSCLTSKRTPRTQGHTKTNIDQGNLDTSTGFTSATSGTSATGRTRGTHFRPQSCAWIQVQHIPSRLIEGAKVPSYLKIKEHGNEETMVFSLLLGHHISLSELSAGTGSFHFWSRIPFSPIVT